MADVKLIPLENHVIVETKADDENTTTKSGIILPDNQTKEKPSQGVVIAVGAGSILDNGQRSPMDVAVGDTVFFTKYAPDEITLGEGDDAKTYLVIKHSSILAKQAA